MKPIIVAAVLAAACLPSAAVAGLRTRSLDRVREEVASRVDALETPAGPAERRIKRNLTAALKLLDRNSASATVDAARIRDAARILTKALPGDEALRDLLTGAMDEFVDELHTDLLSAQERLDLTPQSAPRRTAAAAACARAHAAMDLATSGTLPLTKGKRVAAASLALKGALALTSKSFSSAPLADVHAFQVDLRTGDYVVNGSHVSAGDVQRSLVGALCSRCHAAATDELKASVHYTIAAPTDRVLFPGGGAHGMLDRACGLPGTTGLTNYLSDVNLGECAKCHVGRYSPVMEGFFQASFAQMGVSNPQTEAKKVVDGGLDCLICHSSAYSSRPTMGKLATVAGTAASDRGSPNAVGSARDSRDDADFDHDGAPDLVIDANGDGTADFPLMVDSDGDGTPDRPWPTVAQDRGLTALRAIGKTTEHACLRCHEHARTGYKRGTLFVAGHDVHAGMNTGVFEGAANQCTVCHTSEHHKFVRGHMVGGDLAAADYRPPAPGVAADPADATDLTCQKCHVTTKLSKTVHTTRHLATIACETCHIPYASGITYSAFGQGGHLAFGRNAAGRDTKLVVADMYVGGDAADLDADDLAYRTRPVYTWFNGGTSFLAQTLAVRGMPNAKITPFKPMANGLAFDGRFFQGAKVQNAVGADYNAYSMYRFFANGGNAEAFAALGMVSMTPDEVRKVTYADFQNADPTVQTMALMLMFPNLVYFDKAEYGYEHYLTRTGSPFDGNGDGIIDSGKDFSFDMFAAANSGLRQFQGFNGPMGFPASYEWYPPFTTQNDVVTMKLPDGSEIKMFLKMQAAALPAEQQAPFLAAVENYPSFSQVTLGGHGVAPKSQALGKSSCLDCHGPDGALAHTVPVGRRVPIDMGPMGQVEMPVYRWRYYDTRKLVDLGLATTSESILAGTADVDIEGDTNFVRESGNTFVVNWLYPEMPMGYRTSDDAFALEGSGLEAKDLSTHGGRWMPILEPETDLVPNYRVLGYEASELIWK